VLIVDDTLSLVDLMRDALESEGYQVATCLQSRQACSMAGRIRPDLVILDIVMPEKSGWEVRQCLRAGPVPPGRPIVICTAWAEQAAAELQRLRDPDLWLLPKPFEIEDLLETVAEAVALAAAGESGRLGDRPLSAPASSE
jgi:two-component system sensor histidine kinase/response regulator